MKRRLNIGVALLHRPQVVIMDEPTVGIDPQSRRNILDSVLELNRQGMTVLYTRPITWKRRRELSDHIAIMDQGEVIAYGTHEELVKIVGELDRIDLAMQRPPGRSAGTLAQPGGSASGDFPGWDGDPAGGRRQPGVLPSLFETAGTDGVRITAVNIQEPNLEAVFLHLTGRALRD